MYSGKEQISENIDECETAAGEIESKKSTDEIEAESKEMEGENKRKDDEIEANEETVQIGPSKCHIICK